MSKNITIAEGGNAKSFSNTEKIQTNLMGGGTQYWVPEDEAGQYADLEELSVSENGLYIASDAGHDGFSTVTVAVPGGEIPGGKEVKGIATEDLSLYQAVKVAQGKQDLTKITNDTQEGWLRNSNNLVYRLVNNKYNGYNVTTGALKSKGTSTVYQVVILNGGECAVLRLNNPTSETGVNHTVKLKFLWQDGKSTNLEFEYYANGSITWEVGVKDGLIAIERGIPIRSEDNADTTYDIYNKQGTLITKELCYIRQRWITNNDVSIHDLMPISKSKIACWRSGQVGYNNIMVVAMLNSTGLHQSPYSFYTYNLSGGDAYNFALLGQYGGYWYFYRKLTSEEKYKLYKIPLGDVENDYQLCLYEEKSPNTTNNLNYYGHFQVYIDEKYYLYNIKDLSPVYPPEILENSASHSLLESDKYLVFGRTYLKESQDQIIPTNVYPEQHSDDTVLGIMKEDCEGGEEGTVIVLFE